MAEAFKAQVLVVGGGVSVSWTLIHGPMRTGLGEAADDVVMIKSANTEGYCAGRRSWPGGGQTEPLSLRPRCRQRPSAGNTTRVKAPCLWTVLMPLSHSG
jgi:hypothetical protein